MEQLQKMLRFHAFIVIQELMWLNLERLKRDYVGFEDGSSKHFRNTSNTAIIQVVLSLTHGIQRSKERCYDLCKHQHLKYQNILVNGMSESQ